MKVRFVIAGILLSAIPMAVHSELLGEALPIASLREVSGGPVAAHDPDRGRTLIVWEERRAGNGNILGQWIDDDGSPAEKPFPIAASPKEERAPSVAYDPVSRRYLVAWLQGEVGGALTLMGSFLEKEGGVGDPFLLFQPGRSPSDPVVASAKGRFLLLWGEQREPNFRYPDLFGRFIDSKGKRLGEDFFVGRRLRGKPSVAFNSARGEFVVTWPFLAIPPEEMLTMARLFDAEGKPIAGPVLVGKGRPLSDDSPSVAFAPVGRHYLILWSRVTLQQGRPVAQRSEVMGQFLTEGGEIEAGPFSLSEPSESGLSPTISFEEGGAVALWVSRRSDAHSSIRGVRLLENGEISGPVFSVSSPESSQEQNADGPELVPLSSPGVFLVVWRSVASSGDAGLLCRRLGMLLLFPLGLPQGAVGAIYRIDLKAVQGEPPFQFRRVSGVLPPGLTLDAQEGSISGSPAQAGEYPLQVEVTDARGERDQRGWLLSIRPASKPVSFLQFLQ